MLQDLILAKGEEAFEEILPHRETDDQPLPREPRPVQEASKTLRL